MYFLAVFDFCRDEGGALLTIRYYYLKWISHMNDRLVSNFSKHVVEVIKMLSFAAGELTLPPYMEEHTYKAMQDDIILGIVDEPCGNIEEETSYSDNGENSTDSSMSGDSDENIAVMEDH